MLRRTNLLPDLFVFHRSIHQDLECIEGGAKGIIVDLEFRGKTSRQGSFDTEINSHTLEDIFELKKGNVYVICRSNTIDDASGKELKQIIDNGADEIILPMVKTIKEVDYALAVVNDQSKIAAMIETPEAIQLVDQLDELNLSRFFVGLNDLRIERQENSIFHPFSKGIVQEVRNRVKNTPLGFGGLTVPNHGYPLPVEYFYQEMTRLPCEFTFLRRSFFRDTAGKSQAKGIREILKALKYSLERTPDIIEKDAHRLKEKLKKIIMNNEE